MPGITRIHITGGNIDNRFTMAHQHEAHLNALYREIFPELEDGDEVIEVDKDSLAARYDHTEGIDVILTFKCGSRMTLQEKILTWHESTFTIEDFKSSGKKGAWFNCTCQLYFVGYNRSYDRKNGCGPIKLDDWMLVNFAAFRLESIRNNMPWRDKKQNQHEGRRSTFKIVDFHLIPENCVIARKNDIPKNLFGF